MSKTLNVGMIGYGFMGRAHSNAYRKVGNFFDLPYKLNLKAACARDAPKLKAFADQWGYESTETDWRRLVERKDVDVVDICVPNNLHLEIALAAAQAGKMILCEKPLAMNAAEGEKMVAAVAAYPGFEDLGRKAVLTDVESGAYYGDGYQDILTRVPSIRRAREVLGWQPRVSLDEGIRRTLDFYLRNRTVPAP